MSPETYKKITDRDRGPLKTQKKESLTHKQTFLELLITVETVLADC